MIKYVRRLEMNKRHIFAILILICAASSTTAQMGSNYPNQPIRLMVPWPAGGGVDTTARMIAEPLSNVWVNPSLLRTGPAQEGILELISQLVQNQMATTC